MIFNQPKNRYQAFAVHLIISAIIFIILAAIIIYIWYPGFLFWADGGWQGIRLIAGVDFIIGPILTLLVYRLDKPGLKMDLLLIALVQLICLAGGTWLVYKERPIAIIYANSAFHTMSANSFEFHDLDSKSALTMDNKIPAWVYVELPQEKTARSKILMSQIQDGPVHVRTKLYRPFYENLQYVLKESLDLSGLDEETRAAVTNNGQLYFFNARYSHAYIELDSNNGKFIQLLKRPKPEERNIQPETDDTKPETG